MEREKGQDVASMTCPNCGAETPLVAMPDGGQAQAPCPNCYGNAEEPATEAPQETEQAAQAPAKLKREKATGVPADATNN